MAIRVKQTKSYVRITSPFWEISHNLSCGGIVDIMKFQHGSGANLLASPFVTGVDGWTDASVTSPHVDVQSDEHAATVMVSGRLTNMDGQKANINYQHIYYYTENFIHVTTKLTFSDDQAVQQVEVGSVKLAGELNEYGYRPSPRDDASERKMCSARFGEITYDDSAVIELNHTPIYLLFFNRFVEGFDICLGGDFATWETGLTGKAGMGQYCVSGKSESQHIEVQRMPLHSDLPVTVEAGSYNFSYYLGLPKIVKSSARKWFHLSFGNHPWPSDETIQQWAEHGVNIVRLHNDFASDGNFWHDADWPPYDEGGMQELRRVINTAHEHGIKVVPYFSGYEMHPEAPCYKTHLDLWKRCYGDLEAEYHNHTGNGEFGVQMCLESGWLQRRKHDIKTAYRELGFDGLYFDWVMSLPCDNPHHSDREHLIIDGELELMRWARELVGSDGVLIIHIYGMMPCIPMENFADLVVNMEEISGREEMVKAENMPLVTILGESLPRSPCPSYFREEQELRAKNHIAQLSILGMYPWTGSQSTGWEHTLRYFQQFSRYELEKYKFYHGFSGIITTTDPAVKGAVYAKRNHAIIILSNTGEESKTGVQWQVNLAGIAWKADGSYTVTNPRTGDETPYLNDEGSSIDLDGFDYTVLEMQRSQ